MDIRNRLDNFVYIGDCINPLVVGLIMFFVGIFVATIIFFSCKGKCQQSKHFVLD